MFRHRQWLPLVVGLLVANSVANSAHAREWTDSTGKYKQQADLVAFDDQTVVLKKADGRLVAVPLDKLSKADRDYLKSDSAKKAVEKEVSDDRTWTLADGTKIAGEVINYIRSEITIESVDGTLVVDGKTFRELTKFQQYLVPKIVDHNQTQRIKDVKDVQQLIAAQGGTPLKYPCEGVLLEMENGNKVAVPFFLFTSNDQKMLKPGWKDWLAAENSKQQQQTSFLLRTLANDYQRNSEQSRQIQMMQLLSDWFDLWEVGLNVDGQQTSVTVPARNSEQAAEVALSRYPGAAIQYIRVIDRRAY
jgi:hypothetical protein